MEIKVSVRGLVEFLLRTGDIDNRKKSAPDDAMAEGSRIHRMIQKKMGSSYHAEVMLRYRRDCGEYDLVVEGRADGIIDSDPVAVDEIKGTYRGFVPDEGAESGAFGPGKMLCLDVWAGAWKRADGGQYDLLQHRDRRNPLFQVCV